MNRLNKITLELTALDAKRVPGVASQENLAFLAALDKHWPTIRGMLHIAQRDTRVRRSLVCWLFGHRWVLQEYNEAPKGWSYENHTCERCAAQRRELVAGRLG